MKIRTDFVTNSSSSSFIIARHKNCTSEEVRAEVNNYRNDIKNMIKEHKKWIYGPDDFDEVLRNEDYDKATDIAVNEVVENLMTDRWGAEMYLGEWHISAQIYENDDSEVSGSIMYYFGSKFNTENLKISWE